MLNVFRAEVGKEFRLLATDPVPILAVVISPLVLVGFAAPVYSHLVHTTSVGYTGAGFALPGIAAMFALLLVPFGGFSLFREHGWGTWARLRASKVRMGAVLAGKLIPWFLVALLQELALPLLAAPIFGVSIRGSFLAYCIICVLYAAVIAGLIGLAYSLCTSIYQLNGLGNLGAITLGALGGAFAPVDRLPTWVQVVAHASPAYWVVNALRSVILDGAGLAQVERDSFILLGMAIALGVAAAFTFHSEDAKRSWSN